MRTARWHRHFAEPYLIRKIVSDSGTAVDEKQVGSDVDNPPRAIKEGLRGVVRILTGTAHALTWRFLITSWERPERQTSSEMRSLSVRPWP
jgi:hypothetical protein